MRLEELVGKLLKDKGATLATAESCTGGGVAHRITNIAGSSSYFMGAVVAYGNHVKRDVLHVQEETLNQYGAVSEEVAREMAINARALFGVDYAIAITGIAGPGGATPEKPLGLVYIAVATANGEVKIERDIWTGDRETNKAKSIDRALSLIISILENA